MTTPDDTSTSDKLVRILVLDDDRETVDRLENALWVWPHRIARAGSIEEAVRMCQHLKPTALIAGIGFAGDQNGSTISMLRAQLPHVPIVAVGSKSNMVSPGSVLDQGADTYLLREELQRPTLHDLLQRIQRSPDACDALDVPSPKLPLPWRESKLIGALICDIAGTIVDANRCLAEWLEYPNTDALLGKRVWRDVLNSRADWSAWKGVAGDLTAILNQATSIKSRNKHLLWMNLEVFAAPSSPTHLQAVFVDQTEIALLTGRARDG